jgi:hypothetical protein
MGVSGGTDGSETYKTELAAAYASKLAIDADR